MDDGAVRCTCVRARGGGGGGRRLLPSPAVVRCWLVGWLRWLLPSMATYLDIYASHLD